MNHKEDYTLNKCNDMCYLDSNKGNCIEKLEGNINAYPSHKDMEPKVMYLDKKVMVDRIIRP